jgi:hypothetical protein
MIHLRYKKFDTGIRWLNGALQIDSKYQPSHQALYEHYTRMGVPEKAEAHRKQLRPSASTQSSNSPMSTNR